MCTTLCILYELIQNSIEFHRWALSSFRVEVFFEFVHDFKANHRFFAPFFRLTSKAFPPKALECPVTFSNISFDL